MKAPDHHETLRRTLCPKRRTWKDWCKGFEQKGGWRLSDCPVSCELPNLAPWEIERFWKGCMRGPKGFSKTSFLQIAIGINGKDIF